jgi:transcriptional regulator with XRE-family HTH domain
LVRAVTELGSEVARLLSERGMSLRQAARLAHYDISYLSKVVNGHKPGSAELAEALDKVLDAGGRLAALAEATAPAAAGPAAPADLELIELARRAGASDVASGMLELLDTGAAAIRPRILPSCPAARGDTCGT